MESDDTVRSRDGVAIRYELRGAGRPALVFVHGWCGSRALWKHQVSEFQRDHTTVVMDLAGHGSSGASRAEWTVAAFGADVRAVAERRDLREIVLVGHSMGGPVAMEAALQMPDRVTAVVVVDVLQDIEMQPTDEDKERFHAALRADLPAFIRSAFPGRLHEPADPTLASLLTEQALATDAEAALGAFRGLDDYDFVSAAESLRAPVRAINSASRPTRIEVNRRHFRDYDVVVLEDVGHFPHLEKPALFNRTLRELLESLPR